MLFASLAHAGTVEITQLPLGSAAATTNVDVFPFVNVGSNATEKMTVWDFINVPAMVSTYAPIASPTFTGVVTGNGSGLTTLNASNLSSGTAAVARGGTGLGTVTTNGMPYGNGTSALGVTAAGSQYQVFQAGASGVPTVGALNLGQSAAVTGTLPTGNGGTGQDFGSSTGAVYIVAGAASVRNLAGVKFDFTGSSCPTGSILADGSSQLRSGGTNCGGGSCGSIFVAWGSTAIYGAADGSHFNLPDYRGIFTRGAGTNGTATQSNGGAVAGAALGTLQNDMLQAHYHSYSDPGHIHVENTANAAGASFNWPTDGNSAFGGYGSSGIPTTSSTTGITITGATSDGTNGTPRSGAETHPANLSATVCIWY